MEDMEIARSGFCACVRVHLTACPCLRGLLMCIFNIKGGGGGKCCVGSSDGPENVHIHEIKILTDFTKIINPCGKRSSLVNTL